MKALLVIWKKVVDGARSLYLLLLFEQNSTILSKIKLL